MPRSKHRRNGRTRPRRPERTRHEAVGHDGCEVCQALARGDDDGALAAMFEPPPVGSDRHAILGGMGGGLVLLAHGREWSMPDDAPMPPCPVCGLDFDR